MSERIEPAPPVPVEAGSGEDPAPASAAPRGAPHVRLLNGRYRLAEVLGYGGMAEVYRARDVRLERDVAIKVLRSDLARDPSFQARFKREAQSAASLNHPMIVSVYDTGSDDTHEPPLPYIVMEYVDGRTLREVLQLDGRLTQHRALEIIIDVCAALDYSHRAGIVHRDIKPGNVMITRDGSVKVMDFGIARAIAQSTATVTQTAAVMGTAQYLSPEQARGEKVDARSDLYSTGVVLYELLTGQPPFQGDSPVAVAYQHVREDPTPPSDIESDLPAALDAVVMKMLAKNPSNRYQNAAEMSDDLNRALHGRRVLATPLLREPAPRAVPPKRARNAGPARRRPSAGRLLLVAVLTLLAAGAVTGGLLLARDSGSTESRVAVPPLRGLSLNDAKKAITRSGLAVGTLSARHSDVAAYTVLSTNPEAGTKVNKNAPVALTFSTGPDGVTIPADVIGRTQSDAEAYLRSKGLQTTVTMVLTPGKAVGTVSGTQPVPLTQIVTTQPVTLQVEQPTTKVPDLSQQNLNDAETLLRTADLSFNVQFRDSSAPSGQVLEQDLAPGTTEPRRALVTIVVSRNPPPPPTPTPPPSRTPSPSVTPTPKPTPSLTPSTPPSSSPPVAATPLP